MKRISLARTGSIGSLARIVAVLTVACGLTGCVAVDNALFGGENTSEAAPPPPKPTGLPGTLPTTRPPAGPELSAAAPTSIKPVTIALGSDTGTAVGKKLTGLRSELSAMQGQIVSADGRFSELKASGARSASAYNDASAAITKQLQVGTTRNAPQLISKWNAAQSALDSLTGDINATAALGTQATMLSSQAHDLRNTIAATSNAPGASDEDRRQLSVLASEADQTQALTDRLLKNITEDIQRQMAFVADSRAALPALAAAIKTGTPYRGAPGAAVSAAASAPPAAPQRHTAPRPLVTIRFDHPNIDYRKTLNEALSPTLKAHPNAIFAVVAVSPPQNSVAAIETAQAAAQRNAQNVMHSMSDMGVPAERLRISSSTDPTATASEVRVYMR